jgi:hypothetical protein
MSRRIKSLQLRLMVELAALFFVASCLAVGGLIYSASLTAGFAHVTTWSSSLSCRVGNPGPPLFQSSFSITFLNVVP